MRSTIIIAAFASVAFSAAFAQNAVSTATPDPGLAALPRIDLTPAQFPEPINPAIKTTEGNNPGAPVSGANSFTETQAKSRIEARGYSDVSALKKDEKGIWRGTAMKDGKTGEISLDYQGNVSDSR